MITPEDRRAGQGLRRIGRKHSSAQNVFIILVDDLGCGELGCYGQQKIPTPNIDRLAGQGMRFTQHYRGAPVCAPSRCVLMTGKHLGHAEVRGNLQARAKFPEFTEGPYPRDLDGYVGRVLAALDRAGVAERTLVVFSSDIRITRWRMTG